MLSRSWALLLLLVTRPLQGLLSSIPVRFQREGKPRTAVLLPDEGLIPLKLWLRLPATPAQPELLRLLVADILALNAPQGNLAVTRILVEGYGDDWRFLLPRELNIPFLVRREPDAHLIETSTGQAIGAYLDFGGSGADEEITVLPRLVEASQQHSGGVLVIRRGTWGTASPVLKDMLTNHLGDCTVALVAGDAAEVAEAAITLQSPRNTLFILGKDDPASVWGAEHKGEDLPRFALVLPPDLDCWKAGAMFAAG